jgi:ABC-type multidrug transport system fused ATPase/permease subunit
MELRVGIERSGEGDEDALTRLEITVANRRTGFTSEPIVILPESAHPNYFTVPVEAVGEGDFDVYVRNLTSGNYVGMLTNSLAAVASEASFNWNLAKSLLILWLMAILVVVVAIFCSTFLSWPIAIVLTIVILLGHWAVTQLGEDAGPGVGARIATDLGFQSATQTKVVSQSVEALSRLLRTVANFLPDISRFAAVEDIERGVTISLRRITEPLLVLLTFGLPMLVVAYVILRNKEVAP